MKAHTEKLVRAIALRIAQLENVRNANEVANEVMAARETGIEYAIDHLARNYLPSGSGFDAGTTVDLDKSTQNKIVLNTSFHHMDANGGYDGWTEHVVTIRPDFVHGVDVRVSGRNKHDVKSFISETFAEFMVSVRADPYEFERE